MELRRGCDYGDEVAVADGVTAVFHDAGHILGSAIIELRVAEGDVRRTIVFSGDLGRDGRTCLWRFGPPDAPSTIRGDAGAFCRVGAQRLRPDDSGLETGGPYGLAALRVLRNYAA